MQKQMTLNKAAKVMKRVKDMSRNIYQTKTIAYQVDAIAAKTPDVLAKNAIAAVKNTTENFEKIMSSQLLYCRIKKAIIVANVESGLHEILCDIDQFKNIRQLFQTMLEAVSTESFRNRLTSNMGFMNVDYATLETPSMMEQVCADIISEITRTDSKASSIMLSINTKGFTEQDLKTTIASLTKNIADLEDRKFEINNSTKVTVEIPDNLLEDLGF